MQRLISPLNRPVHCRIDIPGSKSITNRALILAALAKGVSEISDVLLSDDTYACINALKQLGVTVALNVAARSCIVGGCQGRFPNKQATIQCQDAATVARFLLAICAATPGTYSFEASPRLTLRPFKNLITVLRAMGATISPQDTIGLPCIVQGGVLNGGKQTIDGKLSSQFLSALLMVAPLARQEIILETSALVSRPFVDMTCAMMAEFGVLVRRLHPERFSVPVPQHYIARDYKVEPDLSTAACFFAAAAVTAGEVTIQPIHIAQSKQGDIQLLSILKKMGCQIIESQKGLTVKGPTVLQGLNVDMRDCSDTFMALAAIAPFAKTPITMTNIGHTRLQESDRLHAMKTELEKLNIRVEEGKDWLRVHPGQPQPGTIDAHQDHRIAMAFAVIGLRSAVTIEGAECVTKTCPDFFAMWDQLRQ